MRSRTTGDVDAAWRDERAKLVASLARRFRDLSLAEDAVQDAFAEAVRRWPRDGPPDRPGAWLTTTAHRKAIGILRRRRPTSSLAEEHLTQEHLADEDVATAGWRGDLDRDLFGLIFACCHPALDADARVALTLRHVCGLTTAQISAALVTSEAAMAKRLVRARRKIRDAGISFAVPTTDEVAARLDDVRLVIYLVFNEGYLGSDHGPAVRTELCDEAIWLARQLRRLQPDDETSGLLALMLLHHARRDARQDPTGRLVRLPEQRRTEWHRDEIDEARAVLETTGRALGPFQVEAAIALCHVVGPEPDWARIADLHGVLGRLAPSAVVEVNRALAVGRADGPRAGLAVLGPVLTGDRLGGYPHLHAVHADLLERAGDDLGAAAAWRRAAEATSAPDQRAELLRRAHANDRER
ncbi:MAG: sigma-70 family RNA polymerase sigma factor [Actinomycetota bacterium]